MSQQVSPIPHRPTSSKDAASPIHPDRLSMLPMEMKIALLASLPSLETLRTVTLSIPGFYTAYKSRQRHILFHVLLNDLSPEMLGEVVSLHAAGLLKRDTPGWSKDTKNLIIAYEVDRTLGVSLGDQSVEILREFAIRHLSIQSIAWKHAKWAAKNRPDIFECPYLKVDPLSATERTRFYRAFYHYEIFSAIFGRTPIAPVRSAPHGRSLYFSRLSALLDSYHEWEIEEANCVRHFIHIYYQELFKRHSRALGVKVGGIMYDNLDPVITATPFRQYLFKSESEWLMAAANHCAALGFDFLRNMMNAQSEEAELHLLKNYAWLSAMINYSPGLDDDWPRLEHRILWVSRRQFLITPFNDDNWGPSAGIEWATTTRSVARTYRSVGTRSGWNSWLLSWGYALWDSERLDKWGILRSDHPAFSGIVNEYGRRDRVVN